MTLAGSLPVPAIAAPARRPGCLCIKLLDAPDAERDDPRARAYIVDHLNPGTNIHRRVRVSNTLPSALDVELYPAAATIGNDSFMFAPGRTTNPLSTWTTLDRTHVVLARGAAQTVTATINVPASAPAGEQYAVIWAQSAGTTGGSGGIIQFTRVGVRIYLDIGPGGEQPSSVDITALVAGRTANGVPALTAEVHNTGGRAVDLTGTLTLTDGPGSTSAGPFPIPAGTTLGPGQSGSVTIPLNQALPAGPWKAHLTLDSGSDRWEATATVNIPTGGPKRSTPAANPVRTWAVRLAAGATVALLAAVVLVLVWRRRRRRDDQSVPVPSEDAGPQ